MLKYLILLMLFLNSALTCATEIYQQRDAQGNVIYSDTPLDQNAEKLKVSSPSSTTNSTTTHSTTNELSPSGEVTKTTQTETSSVTSRPSESIHPSSSPSNPLGLPNQPTSVTTELPTEQHTLFAIDTPKDQDTIYNQPTIPIKILIVPKLKKGEKIALLLDGKPSGLPVTTTELELSNIDRGTHQLSAVLIDERDQVIKQTNTITIYVHHTSINNIINSPAG